MTSLDSVLVRSPDMLTAEMEGETVIMDTETGIYFALDAIGSDIWRRLAEPIEVRALCVQLERDYDAAAETIRADVLDLLRDLLERRLVHLV